jgi:hypothetical protein
VTATAVLYSTHGDRRQARTLASLVGAVALAGAGIVDSQYGTEIRDISLWLTSYVVPPLRSDDKKQRTTVNSTLTVVWLS